jgi:hypothetical protein
MIVRQEKNERTHKHVETQINQVFNTNYRQLANEQFGALLVAPDVTKGDGSWTVPVPLAHVILFQLQQSLLPT